MIVVRNKILEHQACRGSTHTVCYFIQEPTPDKDAKPEDHFAAARGHDHGARGAGGEAEPVRAGPYLPPVEAEEFGAFLASEIARWAKVIKENKIAVAD